MTVLAKFEDLRVTATGESRASVDLNRLDALWFNTGTLCNITCRNCYIESSPRNDRLAYLTVDDVTRFLDEIRASELGTRLIGFTGGEPFMNRAFPAILEATLARGYETLTLTNAMVPMMRRKASLQRLAATYGRRLRIRVSLDDWRAEVHDAERGRGSFAKTIEGLRWLHSQRVTLEIAGRLVSGDREADLRAGYARVLRAAEIDLDVGDPQSLVLFPEMRANADPPEITTRCWSLLGKRPDSLMCAAARMVVKRKGASAPVVLACTLIPYDERFELGATLREASRPVPLAHPHCATFCVLGGSSCGGVRPDPA